MDIIYDKYNSHIKEYDEIMLQANTIIIQLQMLLSNFVIDILSMYNDKRIDLQIKIPYYGNNGYEILETESILLDELTGTPFIIAKTKDEPLSWSNMSLSVQDLIANYLHIHIKKDDVFRDLFVH